MVSEEYSRDIWRPVEAELALKADRVGCDDASRRRAWVEMVLAMVSGLIEQLAVYVVDRLGLPTLKLRSGYGLH